MEQIHIKASQHIILVSPKPFKNWKIDGKRIGESHHEKCNLMEGIVKQLERQLVINEEEGRSNVQNLPYLCTYLCHSMLVAFLK
jgi:hypothetical protein